VRSWPLRLTSLRSPPLTAATRRCPSCLTSCSQPSPAGGETISRWTVRGISARLWGQGEARHGHVGKCGWPKVGCQPLARLDAARALPSRGWSRCRQHVVPLSAADPASARGALRAAGSRCRPGLYGKLGVIIKPH
jgi:hypothetical protein